MGWGGGGSGGVGRGPAAACAELTLLLDLLRGRLELGDNGGHLLGGALAATHLLSHRLLLLTKDAWLGEPLVRLSQALVTPAQLLEHLRSAWPV